MKKVEKTAYQGKFADVYAEYLRKNKFEPTRKQFDEYCEPIVDEVTGDTVTYKDVFGKYADLRAAAFEQNEDLKDYVFNETSFDDAYSDRLDEAVKTHKRFIITTAVSGKPADIDFYHALQNYAKRHDAIILLIPCQDVRGSRTLFKINLDPAFKDSYVAFRDVFLNNNVGICVVEMSAKARNPLTSMAKFTVRLNRSFFFPACKQTLKNIPYYKGDIPKFMATPGAVTINDFDNEYFMSKRTSRLAELDYQAGAFIVELEDENIYHKRPIQARPDGSFVDINAVYHPDGTVEEVKESLFVMGDSHVGATDNQLKRSVFLTLADNTHINTVVLHDLCNSASISHHEENDWVKLLQRANDGTNSLLSEINACVRYLNDLTSIGVEVVVVNSNHDNHIEKCIRNMAFVRNRDFKNADLLLDAYMRLVKGDIKGGVLEYLVTERATEKLEHPELIRWLALDESYLKYGIELGFHGHLGANGAKGSLKTFENAFNNVVLGHSHSGAIQCEVMQVGTTSELDMEYNKGLSSWTRTCCICHDDGTKQLIDYIPNSKGEYHYHV